MVVQPPLWGVVVVVHVQCPQQGVGAMQERVINKNYKLRKPKLAL